MTSHEPLLLDCTLRDGGYHNDWDFPVDLIEEYLRAMVAASVDFVELGFRSLEADGFRGGCAYTTDGFIRQLDVPTGLTLGVMVNTGELNRHESGVEAAIDALFTPADDSPVTLVRLASHFAEIDAALAACNRLHELGYLVGVNLMQIADRTDAEIEEVARRAAAEPPNVLYFADSLGSMDAVQTSRIIEVLRRKWNGPLGIHTHDNMGRALVNSLQAMEDGVTWIDATVTGMGRGPGNAKTEHLVIEVAECRHTRLDMAPLLSLVEQRFRPMQLEYGWGTNAYYYLAGKFGIHPTYVQSMLTDARFAGEDVLAVLDFLRLSGGERFSVEALETGRSFYDGQPSGSWAPSEVVEDRVVLILGSGPGVEAHRQALTSYIESQRPLVIAFNTDSVISDELIDFRIASHPVRLLSNAPDHLKLPQPLVAPASALPTAVRNSLKGKDIRDYGLAVARGEFRFDEKYCVLPSSMTVAYALAFGASGRAAKIELAGFDGYATGDPRNSEVDDFLVEFQKESQTPEIVAITPTRYSVSARSVYSVI